MAVKGDRLEIGIRRHFTTEGVHPYDEVVWERRDSRITDYRDGSVAFEQLKVEVPADWSMNATNILAQKYFRGTLGTPEREWSLRQVVDRVVGSIKQWGVKDGYFADGVEAETFAAELAHLIVRQKAAFNSPVWFNIGVAGVPQQAAACQPYDALVSTPDGLVPIGRLVEESAVGTKVFDASGVTSIVAVKHNGRKDVLRIHTKSGHTLDVTGDHLVWRASGDGTGAFVEASTLQPGDQLTWHRTEAWGRGEFSELSVAEAALAGWLQSDGFVGQYEGTHRSLTIECITVNNDELRWVLSALDKVFPDAHRHERQVELQDKALDCRRTRLYGRHLEDFVTRWGLRSRGVEMTIPEQLFEAPLPVVAAYLRSVFQAEGSVSVRSRSAVVSLSMISEDLVRGLQRLLARFGIFSRVRPSRDPRPNRHDCWTLSIRPLADRRIFADEIGFVDERKAGKLVASLDLAGHVLRSAKRLEIERVEQVGEQDVYDIQTESGEYLSGSLRVHNCFILAVDDQMDSILNWYVEEGTIFKGGSGAGTNLSRIRSSKELLAGGGTASGPVSFMRGADASAGTIKSGGKTRRAAKMVILDADHPDVQEFIWCKAKEERKARVLSEAGFDMDLDGADSHSLQYQNANNSVRLTDEFMQAVLADADWELRTRTTGEVVERIPARHLFRQIAEAAWECADPGLQFDTTINNWHTAPNTGRINASNPCSEYVHLDNSSCNLASINLLAFLGVDGTFDVEGFKAAVEVVFTAQEILVGNADYPTEKIADTTRRFRQLGLGYANLGALLMAEGVPYDSDSGRAWAGAITALMTGHAYAVSARTAARMGPFAGFHENSEPMVQVLRMHRDAVAQIDEKLVAPDLLAAVQDAWDEAVEMAEVHGVRNSQATVLAPTGTISFLMDCDTTGIEPDLGLVKTKKLVGGGTMSIVNQTIPRALRKLGYGEVQVSDIVAYVDEHKSIVGAPHLHAEHLPVFACSMGDNTIHYSGHVRMMGAAQPFISGAISKCVVGGTLLTTTDGLVRIGALHRGEAADTFRHEVVEVASLDGSQKTDAFYYGGLRPVREVTLRSGHRVSGTSNHRLLVAGGGGLEWRRLDEIAPGDAVAIQYGAELWSALPVRFDGFTPTPRVASQKAVRVPQEMDHELAFLLGAYAAEGHTNRSNWTVVITNSVEGVLERVATTVTSCFGIVPRIERQPGKCPAVVFSSKTVVEFLEYLGCGARASEKRIPEAVLGSPRSMVLAFFQGLALDAYVTVSTMPKWAICLDSAAMLDDIQAVLTNLGIVHGRSEKFNPQYQKSYGEVYATGADAQALVGLVPFLEPDKGVRAEALVARAFADSGTADVVPGISPAELYSYVPYGERNDDGELLRTEFNYLADRRTQHVTRHSVVRVSRIPGVVLPAWLQSVIADDLHFSPVVAACDAGVAEVFDLSVPATQAFVGNGIVNHNTVNMPQEATVEDVEQLHIDAWRLGLKAVAIYRDNCKVAQPLSTTKKEPAAVSAAPSVEEANLRDRVAELEAALLAKGVEAPAATTRKRLPRRRRSNTFAFRVADCEGYVTVGEYEDGRPGEVFMKVSKQGSTLSGVMDAFSIAVSLGLQHGVPLSTFVRKYTNMRFEPAGITDDSELRLASSLVDYIFRRLAVDYLDEDERVDLGVMTTDERMQPTLPGFEEAEMGDAARRDRERFGEGGDSLAHDRPAAGSPAPVAASAAGVQAENRDAPFCYACGNLMQRAGSCYACPSCGATSGCS
jgi:ribonucleoside-diphosphate reductase alpha chain